MCYSFIFVTAGFGQIGRLVLRIATRDDIEVVAVNDPIVDAKYMGMQEPFFVVIEEWGREIITELKLLDITCNPIRRSHAPARTLLPAPIHSNPDVFLPLLDLTST